MKNRWLIALCSVGIHICIGSVYAWSVLNKPLREHFGLPEGDTGKITMAFTVAIFFLGVSAAFLGRFIERRGPRVSGMLAAVLFGAGLIGAGLAVRFHSLPWLYIAYGVVGGTGLGLGYLAPVATLLKWFPDKRGLATGMAIMGFGFAALIATYAMEGLIAIPAVGIEKMFYILGAVYALVMFCSASYLAPPPEGYAPAGYDPAALKPRQMKFRPLAELTAAEALGTVRFYLLWLMLFLNIACGIAVISVAKDIAAAKEAEMTAVGGETALEISAAANMAMTATAMVALMSLFNGLGRIGWSSLSDHLGRPLVWILFFAIQVVAYAALAMMPWGLPFQIVVFLIMTCYGGGFASMPAYVSDVFGTRQVSTIYGYILTAWAMGGILGPRLTARIFKATGSYNQTLYIFAATFVLALIVALVMARIVETMRRAAGAEDVRLSPEME